MDSFHRLTCGNADLVGAQLQPQRNLQQDSHLVVSTRNGQDVPCDGPADVPNHISELVQQLGRPRVSGGVITRPDEHASVLQENCC